MKLFDNFRITVFLSILLVVIFKNLVGLNTLESLMTINVFIMLDGFNNLFKILEEKSK